MSLGSKGGVFIYFLKKLEKGEAIDDNDLLFSTGEARDDISLLPRSAAVKIFSYLSIVDLYRCAQVCRSWKMITNSNVLWSKVSVTRRSSLNYKYRVKYDYFFINLSSICTQ